MSLDAPSTAAITRLARAGGVRCLSGAAALEGRRILLELVAEIARLLVIVREQQGSRTIMPHQALRALAAQGVYAALVD